MTEDPCLEDGRLKAAGSYMEYWQLMHSRDEDARGADEEGRSNAQG
jgi:hypothetical protein